LHVEQGCTRTSDNSTFSPGGLQTNGDNCTHDCPWRVAGWQKTFFEEFAGEMAMWKKKNRLGMIFFCRSDPGIWTWPLYIWLLRRVPQRVTP
jgi:hypothetical protein